MILSQISICAIKVLPVVSAHDSQITFSCLHDVRQHMAPPRKIESSGQQSANQRISEKITCVTKVPPLTEKRKISWQLLKIENQFFPLSPGPFPPRARGGRGTFFVGFCRRATPACKTPYFFSPSPTAYAPWGCPISVDT